MLGYTDITARGDRVRRRSSGCEPCSLILCGALYTTAVDPDEVLRLFRRVSFRSALTATLATRLVPVLVRDARRLADAQRCRPGRPPSRAALMRAATAGVLDRALDVAAALEVRGYGGRAPARRARASALGRGTISQFAAAAVAVLALSIGARIGGLWRFHAYPSLDGPVDAASCVALPVGCWPARWLPFADRRGIER